MGGILFPIIFTASAITICWLFPQYNLVDMNINGENAPGLIFAPVTVPIYIDILFSSPTFGLSEIHEIWLKTTLLVIFDFVTYTSLTCFVIWYFDLLKPKTKLEYSFKPPPPPEFFLD